MFASRTTWQKCVLAFSVSLTVVIAPLAIPKVYAQDSLAQARIHYKKGSQLFSQGSFQAAIGEFAAADKLSHSAMLEYNIALCYDRLGDRAEALRRYRLYLKEVPNGANSASVEGKIRRLEGALRMEAEARRKAQEAAAATPPPPVTPPVVQPPIAQPPIAQPPVDPVPLVAPANPVYKPGAAQPTPAFPPASAQGAYQGNDPELARVAAIDVAAIRDQRGGGNRNGQAGSSMQPNGQVGSMQPNGQVGSMQPNGQVGSMQPNGQASGTMPNGSADPNSPNANAMVPPDSDKGEDPFYKQWWFWVAAGFGAIVLINFASTGSDDDPQNRALTTMPNMMNGPSAPRGLEWRF